MPTSVNLADEYEAPEVADLSAEYELPDPNERRKAVEGAIETTYSGDPIRQFVTKQLLTTGGQAVDTALNVAIPIGGSIIGSLAAPGVGTAAGGAGGAGVADLLVQTREAIRGEREELSPGRTIAASVVGAIPMARGAGGVIGTAATRASQGVVLGAGQEALGQFIDEDKVDFARVAEQGAWGALFGAGAGTIEGVAPKIKDLFSKLGKKTPAQAIEEINVEIAKDTTTEAEKQQLTDVQKRIQAMLGIDDRELAPATFVGVQEGVPAAGIPNFELFNLNQDAAGTVANSTVTRQTLEKGGFRVPQVPEVAPGTRVDIPLTEPTAADSAAVFQQAISENQTPEALEALKKRLLAEDMAAREAEFDRMVQGRETMELPSESLPIPEEITPAQQSAAVFENAFREAQTPQGAVALRDQLEAQARRANEFQRARFEESLQEWKGNQLAGDESVMADLKPLPDDAQITMWRMGAKESVAINIPEAGKDRPGFSGSPEDARAEGYDVQLPRWMDEGQFTYAEIKPKQRDITHGQGEEAPGPGSQQSEISGEAVRDTRLNGQERQALRLSPQAQRVYDQYGFIDAALLRGLTSAGGGLAGGAYGITQGDTAEERIKNGLTYAVLGAGGGYMLGNAFRAASLARTPTSTNKNLDRWYKRLSPKDEGGDWKEKMRSFPNALRRELTTSFAPLDKLPEQIARVNRSVVAAPHIPLSRQFELVNGASAKATVDVEDYAANVLSKVDDAELKDFNVLLALKRTGQRLQADMNLAADQARILTIPENQRTAAERAILDEVPDRRRVGGETLPEVDDALSALRVKLGDKRFSELDQLAAGSFQQEADKALRILVASGRMSKEQYAGIKASNDFYAPFRVMEAAEEFDGFKGTRSNPVDTTTKYTRAIKGIDDPNFTLDDPAKVLGEKIYQARVLAEKNLKMRVLADLADQDASGTVLKKLGPGESAPRGMETVNWFDDGTPRQIAVAPDIAEAVKGMNPAQTGIIARFVQAVNKPFRFGATAGNIGFQAVNAPFDQARLAIMSKYGIGRGTAIDTWSYPLDLVQSMYAAMSGNRLGPQTVGAVSGFYTGYMAEDDPEKKLQSGLLGGAAGLAAGSGARRVMGQSDLYRRFAQSGAAGSTLQDMIERLGGQKSVVKEVTSGATGVIGALQDFGKVIEETTKIMGFKRGLRIEGIDKLPPAQAAKKLEEVVSEVRNFAGSPDFSVAGNMVRDLNAAVVFLNPRIQGMAEDYGRLLGRDGAKNAAQAWTALASAVGIGSATLWASNQRPENAEDYEKVSPEERHRYAMIPRYNEDGTPMYFTNERGDKVRDYWRIPLRDTSQNMYQLVQSALDFAKKDDPDAAMNFAAQLAENLSPISFSGDNMSERMESFISGFGPVGTVPYMLATGRNPGLHRDIVQDRDQKAGDAEGQYTNTTPEVYRTLADAAPQFLADPLRSPLMLESLTQAMTGGVLNQFTPPKALADRDPTATALQQSPLGRRFVRSTYVHSDVPEELETRVREQANVKATETRDTRALFDELSQLPVEQRRERARSLSPEDRTALREEFDRRQRRPSDREIAAIKTLNVENGQRAQYIVERLGKLDPDKRGEFARDLQKAGLLSDNVKRQIGILAARQQR